MGKRMQRPNAGILEEKERGRQPRWPYFRELLFDEGIHSLGKGALNANHRVVLDQNVFLEESKTAFASLGWGDLQVLVDCPLG
jgi:hypothetical protein